MGNNKNKIEYLSDIKWENQRTSYGTIRRDIAHDGVTKLKLREKDNSVVIYDKGVGIHSIGEITVDLIGKGYNKFEASVGVLQGTDLAKSKSSLQYEFYLNGILVKRTPVIKYDTPKEYISIDLPNWANKLKIIVNDGGNGIAGDWGVLADAKFIR